MDSIFISQVISQAIAFLVFFLILRWLAWKPILKHIDDRRERIQSEFDEIASLKQEVEKMRVDYDKRIAAVEDEAHEKIAEGIKEGRRVAEEIAEKARQESRERIEKAKQLIDLELEKSREDLKESIVRIAMQTTEHVLHEKMDEEKHKSLVDRFMDELNSRN